MGKEWQFKVQCPLGDHKAAFDHSSLTLDCEECGYALSSQAAASLLRLSDHRDMLAEVVDEYLESLEPSKRLERLVEESIREKVGESLRAALNEAAQ
jgi:hypothetical protein